MKDLTTRSAASLRKVIYADREDIALEEGDHFIADLIGLKVFDADTGENYGEIDVCSGRAGSCVVSRPDGATSLCRR